MRWVFTIAAGCGYRIAAGLAICRFGILAIMAALLTACALTAKGSCVIYTVDPNFDMGSNSEVSGSIPIPRFDPALGNLDAVQIYFGSGYGGTVTVSGPDGASGSSDIEEQTIFQDPGNNIYEVINNEWTCYFSLPRYDPGGSSEPGTYNVTYDSPAVLSEFTGTGNFDLGVTGTQHADSFMVPPGVTVDITDGDFGADAIVNYIYTVPEPGCASLLAVGFGLMLASRKKPRGGKINPRV